jgi:hypothetical protein
VYYFLGLFGLNGLLKIMNEVRDRDAALSEKGEELKHMHTHFSLASAALQAELDSEARELRSTKILLDEKLATLTRLESSSTLDIQRLEKKLAHQVD